MLPLLIGLLAPAAFAGGLALDPAHPPTAVAAPEPRWDFGPAGVLAVRPAVVLRVTSGPVPTGAAHLGGPFWSVPTATPAEAVSMALGYRQTHPEWLSWPDVRLPKVAADVAFDDPNHPGQWYLEELEMDALYAHTLGDSAVKVAVLDSGIDIAHVDLAAGVDAPYDAFADDGDPSPNPGEYCASGSGICDDHGTAVSGIVGARANNGEFIVGLCPECTVVPIKLLGESGGSLGADIRAFEHAIAQDVAVINNSWGFVSPTAVPDSLAEVIHRAATEPRGGKGALVVFAAGNDDREINDNELQALEDVLCVSATDSYGNPTAYTNSGASVDLAAPSATVSIGPGDTLIETFGGTSAAAPVVSGLAGWAVSVDPSLTAAELHQLMVQTARPSPKVTHDEDGHHPTFGYGELDALAILDALTRADTGSDGGGSGDDGGGSGGGEGTAKGCTAAPIVAPVWLAMLLPWLRRRPD